MPIGGVTVCVCVCVWFQSSHIRILVYLLVTVACSIALCALITENTYLLVIINNNGGVAGRKTGKKHRLYGKKQLPEALTF